MRELNANNEKWIVYSITEDDFVEMERCSEQLVKIGLNPEANSTMVLRCQICPLSGKCQVTRENAFLGVRTY
jgi:hypothetical protein